MTEHEGTISVERIEEREAQPEITVRRYEVLTEATCSCGWASAVYRGSDGDPRAQIAMEGHLATAMSATRPSTDELLGVAPSWCGGLSVDKYIDNIRARGVSRL